MHGTTKELRGWSLFHHLPLTHYQDIIGDMTDHGQIVGDEHIGEPLVTLQFFQQIQNLGLDGYVQGGDRLVTYHEIRVQRKCTGDADPLAAPVI